MTIFEDDEESYEHCVDRGFDYFRVKSIDGGHLYFAAADSRNIEIWLGNPDDEKSEAFRYKCDPANLEKICNEVGVINTPNYVRFLKEDCVLNRYDISGFNVGVYILGKVENQFSVISEGFAFVGVKKVETRKQKSRECIDYYFACNDSGDVRAWLNQKTGDSTLAKNFGYTNGISIVSEEDVIGTENYGFFKRLGKLGFDKIFVLGKKIT